MSLLFCREILQFTESNPYKISANDAVMLYGGIFRAGCSLLFLYYQLLLLLVSSLDGNAWQCSQTVWISFPRFSLLMI